MADITFSANPELATKAQEIASYMSDFSTVMATGGLKDPVVLTGDLVNMANKLKEVYSGLLVSIGTIEYGPFPF